MTPAVDSAARAARVGATVAHYRIVRAIGGGGMGDVYEAEDLRLGRQVALKFLASSREPTAEDALRLEREARAASALNHPHICTIHDIGEHLGERFIAMELLDGETLRDRLKRGPLPIDEALSLGIALASALDAAHRAHVVHRDVTPANVFLTRGGTAKLLDFGLSRPEPSTHVLPGDASSTRSEVVLTSPGTIVGTVAYMSPEQVRGDLVDHRTDIFSLGTVLYEALTARRPFGGKTTALVFDAILHGAPAPIDSSVQAPSGLQAILDKALEKDRTLRYQHALELKTDLERVRRDGVAMRAPVVRRRRWVPALLLAASVALTLATVTRPSWCRELPPSWQRVACGAGDRIPEALSRPVTSGRGIESEPAISPDGHTIAFTSDESGNDDIWLVDVSGGPTRRLTSTPASDSEASWFPDGRSIVFASDRRVPGRMDLWRAPVLDGDAATLFVRDGESPAISPDGAQVAFVRDNAHGYKRVAVASVAAPGNVRVLTGDAHGRWNHYEPAWSPDGTRICYSAWDGLWIVEVATGRVERLTSRESDGHPTWSPSGAHVYFSSYTTSPPSLWRVDVSGTSRERVTRGSGAEVMPQLSRDGRAMVFASHEGDDDLVLVDRSEPGHETRFGTGRDDLFPAFASDGRGVYFTTDRWGVTNVWRQALDGSVPVGEPERVFEQDGKKARPAPSPDGRWLAYYRTAGTRRDVWIVATSGGAPAQVTTDGNSIQPAWSPGSSMLVFASDRDGRIGLWTQQLTDGRAEGDAVSLTGAWPHFALFPAWSPDGTLVAFITLGATGLQEVAIVPARGGHPRVVTSHADAQGVRWSGRDGTLLVSGHWGTAGYELRQVRLDGSSERLPVALGNTAVGALFDVSPDGSRVVLSRGAHVGHVWVMEAQSRSF